MKYKRPSTRRNVHSDYKYSSVKTGSIYDSCEAKPVAGNSHVAGFEKKIVFSPSK